MKGPVPYSITDKFEELYIRLREKEGRIYKDEEVARLPLMDPSHPNYSEWKTRARSLKKLLAYIKQKGTGLNILEVGCGNGWLSAQLAAVTSGEVIGTDINKTELEQAGRVFRQIPNLAFINSELQGAALDDMKFDLIIFAASIQYFSSLKEITDEAFEHLTATGEIHILDSHFYSQGEIAAARLRTKDYYATMAFDVLTNYYHHHSIEELGHYHCKILHDPHSWKHKLSAHKNPFYWIAIKNRKE